MVVLSTHTERTQISVSDERAARCRQWQTPSPRGRQTHERPRRKGHDDAGFSRNPQSQGLYNPEHEHDACGVGFVVNIKGERSHEIVRKGLQVLDNLTHRGACGCDPLTGDGAGMLMQIPHEFLVARGGEDSASRCPRPANTASGWSSCRSMRASASVCEEIFERVVREEGQRVLGWRDGAGRRRRNAAKSRARDCPSIRQIFIGARRAYRGPGSA